MTKSDIKATFQFQGFQILESLIKKEEGATSGNEFSVGFNPRGEICRKDRTFKLLLGVKVEESQNEFLAKIEAVGNFAFEQSIEEDKLSNLFYVNAPAILFPYIRAYISTLTNLSGIETITLPTLNLTSLGGKLKDQTVEI